MLAGGVLASCSGGGGGSGPVGVVAGNSFAFTSPGASVSEGGAALLVTVELTAPGAALGEAITIDVVDLGNGTATAVVDFNTIGTQTLTFPAGSVNGDVQAVSLTAFTDLRIEGADETVTLALQNQSDGSLGATSSFLATILDSEEATIQFALSNSATADESPGTHGVTLELGVPAGVILDATASVIVSDTGTGSASSGTDYATFAPQAVSFAAGSLDGDTRSVNLTILGDNQAELDETVVLGAASPSEATAVGALSDHTVTITDDDVGGLAALYATEGATGTETGIDHDDLIDLGSQTVGAGPNAGTRLRISNIGGNAMSLEAPILTGPNGNDFVLEIELAPLVAGNEPPPHDMATPLTARLETSAAPGVALALDLQTLAELESYSNVRLHGFPIPGQGEVTLELERVRLPIAAGAELRVDGVSVPGGLEMAVQGVTVWKGVALELPGSRAFLTFSDQGPMGFLQLPFGAGRIVHLFTEEEQSSTGEMVCRVVHEDDLLALGAERPATLCSGERTVPGMTAQQLSSDGDGPKTENLTAADCVLAIETDYQLFQKFGSASATTNYVTQLIAAISDQYFTDTQTTLSISYLGVYTTAADPWTSQDSGGDAGDLLDEFRAAWVGAWPAVANLAHFVSGANLGGGIAYIDVLCNQTFGFGVSGNINGNVDWGSWTGNAGSFTWDFVVVAHELGHNFGTGHTHSYCPPLDLCYNNCDGTTVCTQGTLMSYCHVCGGMDNIELNFHPVVANVMRANVGSSCLGSSSLAGGDYVQYLVRFNPLTNTGTRTATIQFGHDAPNQPQPFLVQLQGNAD